MTKLEFLSFLQIVLYYLKDFKFPINSREDVINWMTFFFLLKIFIKLTITKYRLLKKCFLKHKN